MQKRMTKCRVCALLLCLLAAAGCAPRTETTQAEATHTPQVEIIGLAPEETADSALVTATPSPDMLFEDDGDIYFSADYASTFSAKTFAFPRAPRVLIYHTHAEESFRAETPEGDAAPSGNASSQQPKKTGATPEPAATPTATPSVRSKNPAETVVHLGEVLETELQKRGFTVFHDTTDVEAPSLSTAYVRSRAVMEQYTDIDIYIDLHRNAANAERAKNDVVLLDGARTARMFFVVGTGLTAADTSGELPNWKENYALALSLTEQLMAVDGTLCKDIRVKQKAYNQDLGLCLLAEIGHNANLLTDAERTIPYFADALAAVCTFPTA